MIRHTLWLAAAGMLCGVAVRASLHDPPPRTVLDELVRSRPERAFAPRLSLGMKYRRCTSRPAPAGETVPREACGAPADAPVNLHAFAAAGQSFDPDSLRTSALAGIIWWDEAERSLNDAISRLEKALRLTRTRVPLLVDLSAAHLVRAERTQNPRDLAAGLNYAKGALLDEPRNHAALFNAALALQALYMDEQAAEAWDAYLAGDSVGPWAEEARRRKRALLADPAPPPDPPPAASAEELAAFAGRWPQEARLLGWERALGDWGIAKQAGASSAGAFLRRAEALGTALAQRPGGDASLRDAVQAIRAAQGNASATAALARAHREYADAHAYLRGKEFESAEAAFRRALRERAPSPVLVQWAEASLGGALVYLGRYKDADERFRAVLARMDTSHHPALEARTRWMRGSGLLRTSAHAKALAEYSAAAAIFERLGEAEHLGAVLSNLGEAAYEDGDTLKGYRYLHAALRTARPYRASVFLHNPLANLGYRAVLDGMPRAAAAIQDEDVAVAMRVPDPVTGVEALLIRAHVRMAGDDSAGAARDLDSAAIRATRVPADVRGWVEASLRLTRSLVRSRQSGAPSLAAMDTAVVYFTEQKNPVWLLPALLGRAEARRAAGDLAGATADLETMTARIHELSGTAGSAVLQAAVRDRARTQFNRLVMLHLHAGRNAEALRVLERSRTSFGPAGARGEALAAPPGQVAVVYALIGDTLLAWTLRGDSLDLSRQVVNRDEFLLVVDQVGVALESAAGEDRFRPGLRRLYDWLVRPVRERLGAPGTPLVIVADGEVAGVPFPALLGAGRDQYLVRDHSLRFAATLAEAAVPRPADGRAGPALLIADPEFEAHRHPTLDPLPGARAEVRALRALYPGSTVLQGAGATRAALERGARSARVIHYAGHALFDDTRPERSLLLLAGADGAGELTADAVYGLPLRGVRLVVLSACGTLRAREGRSGGFAGLSGALLTAGAGGVVGNLWQVNDRRTQPLMVVFHHAYLRSGDPAAALRQAQLEMMRSTDPQLSSPATWAGFRYAGR